MMLYNPKMELLNDNMYTKFGLIPSIQSQDIEQKQIQTSIKGRNSVANLQKVTLYNPHVELVNDNVYTKFGLILSIHSQDIDSKNQILLSIKGRNSVANLQKKMLYNI